MLVTDIRNEMVLALKQGKKERKDTLSMLVSALDIKAKEKRTSLTPDEEFSILYKELKQTKETIEFTPIDRVDIIEKCNNRISVIESFLPIQMTVDEIKGVVDSILLTLNILAPTKSDKGRIMKELIPQTKGKSDGKLVNSVLESYF